MVQTMNPSRPRGILDEWGRRYSSVCKFLLTTTSHPDAEDPPHPDVADLSQRLVYATIPFGQAAIKPPSQPERDIRATFRKIEFATLYNSKLERIYYRLTQLDEEPVPEQRHRGSRGSIYEHK